MMMSDTHARCGCAQSLCCRVGRALSWPGAMRPHKGAGGVAGMGAKAYQGTDNSMAAMMAMVNPGPYGM